MSARARPPRGLGAAGQGLWRSVVCSFELQAFEEAMLAVACRQADTVAALEQLVAEQGLTVVGSSGQPRLNGAVAELRQGRLALAKLLSELALPADTDGVVLASPASRRASRAATARHDRARRAEARRLGVAGGAADS